MNKKLKIVFIIAVLFLIVSFVSNWEKRHTLSLIEKNNQIAESVTRRASVFSGEEKIPAKIGEASIFLERAVTSEERELGLSYRESLREDSGLLFVFDALDFYGFWMKDMKFPIDIIWLDSNFKIVDIEEGVRPESYPKVFTPKFKSLFVLEVNSGFVRENDIKIGEKLSFNIL